MKDWQTFYPRVPVDRFRSPILKQRADIVAISGFVAIELHDEITDTS